MNQKYSHTPDRKMNNNTKKKELIKKIRPTLPSHDSSINTSLDLKKEIQDQIEEP